LGKILTKNNAILSYLSPYLYTNNVKILLKRTGDLGIHQRHKMSSESLKGHCPAEAMHIAF